MHGIQLIRALTPNLKDTAEETAREGFDPAPSLGLDSETLGAMDRNEAYRREYEGRFYDSQPLPAAGTYSNMLPQNCDPRKALKEATEDLRNAPLRVHPDPLPVVPLWLLWDLSD